MSIGIDYTAAVHQSAGIGRYTRELVKTLARLSPSTSQYHLFVAGAAKNLDLTPPAANFTYHPTRLTRRWLERLWYRFRLPLWINLWTGPLALFHSPDFVLPPVKPGTRALVTVHDLSFVRQPNSVMPGMTAYLNTWVPRSVQRADHVITISAATRQDLIDLYHAPPEKITTLYPGVSSNFTPVSNPAHLAAVRHKYGLNNRPFILSVSTLQPRKNYRRLIQALAQIDPSCSLVIAGDKGWHYVEIFAEVTRLGLENRVIFPGFVAEADLPALYSAASLFVYPSLYEGFGLPLLEAMACGAPVVAANTSSLPEVAGPAGILVNPYDVDALAAAISQVLANSDLRQRLIEAGLSQAKKFTWEGMGEKLLKLYAEIIDLGSPKI